MANLCAVFRLECRRQLAGTLFLGTALALFLLGLLATASEGIHLGDVGPLVRLNAPYAILAAQHVLAIPAAFAGVAFVGAAMARERGEQRGTDDHPTPGVGLLLGRVGAATLATFLCAAAGLFGTLAGALVPWLDPARLGTFSWAPYWHALWAVAAPNAFIVCGLAAVVAVHARAVQSTCAVALALLLMVATAGLVADRAVVALLDPIGTTAFAETTRYWTIFERNAHVPVPSGSLLASRLVWLGLALACLGVAAWRYGRPPGRECAGVLRSPPTVAAWVAAGAYLFVWARELVGGGYVPPSLPVGDLVEGMAGDGLLPVRLAVVCLAGVLVHRPLGHEAVRPPALAGQTSVLLGLVAGLLAVGGLGAALATSAASKGTAGLAAPLMTLYGVLAWDLLLLAVVSVAVHALAGNPLRGTVAMLLVLLWRSCAVGLGFEHPLHRFGLPVPYADGHGHGYHLEPLVTLGAYWSAFAMLLLLAAAGRRRTPSPRSAVLVAGLVWLGLGAWIFHNTNVLNAHETRADRAAQRAEYERRFGRHADAANPQVLSMDLAVDIHPERRALRSRGTMLLGNADAEDIVGFVVSLPRAARVEALKVPAALVERADGLGVRRYAFDPPLRPTERVKMTFDLTWEHAGFGNAGPDGGPTAGGTRMAARDLLPLPGYDASLELTDPRERRRQGLGPAAGSPAHRDDAKARGINALGVSHRATVKTRLGTSLDQIAFGPGRLVRAWGENDRSYFEYATDRPVWPRFSLHSGPHAVARGAWDDVEIEVYHAPGGGRNASRVIACAQRTLDYLTAEFSPHRPARVRFVHAPPGASPCFDTALELAGQWWAEQVVGAAMAGSSFLVETPARYSALMVLRAERGDRAMGSILKRERDAYLSARGRAAAEELPLRLAGPRQGDLYAHKGVLAMHALREAIGEAAVNRALRRFLARHALRGPPFPGSGDLIALFREEAGLRHHALIADLFEHDGPRRVPGP